MKKNFFLKNQNFTVEQNRKKYIILSVGKV